MHIAAALLVVPDGRILFEDGNVWKTCDADGKNEALLGDGLKGHGFPALSSDGRRGQGTRARRHRPEDDGEPQSVGRGRALLDAHLALTSAGGTPESAFASSLSRSGRVLVPFEPSW
jgi:hypothetical protein